MLSFHECEHRENDGNEVSLVQSNHRIAILGSFNNHDSDDRSEDSERTRDQREHHDADDPMLNPISASSAAKAREAPRIIAPIFSLQLIRTDRRHGPRSRLHCLRQGLL